MCSVHQVQHTCGHATWRCYSHCRGTRPRSNLTYASQSVAACSGFEYLDHAIISYVACGPCQNELFEREWGETLEAAENALRCYEQVFDHNSSVEDVDNEEFRALQENLELLWQNYNKESWKKRLRFPPEGYHPWTTPTHRSVVSTGSPLKTALYPEDFQETKKTDGDWGWSTDWPGAEPASEEISEPQYCPFRLPDDVLNDDNAPAKHNSA